MSRRTRDLIAIGLGFLSVAIAAYLTLVHYEEELLVCSVVSGCKTVQSSEYAMVGPAPVALLGLLASLVMLGIAIARPRLPEMRFTTTAVLAGMLLAGLLYLGYLTWLELFVIEAICQWCVAYLIVTLLWFGHEAYDLRAMFVTVDDDFDDA
ncbi:MAG: vitamin K epoxide reductase [Thermomicrobiales bacterium]|nr:vitamin K epoxide reductase [Thermomicrobiales bacterium]